jgi:hypothetical protein
MLLLVGGVRFFILRQEEEEERSFLSHLPPLFSLLVLLSWDLILFPYWEGGWGWYSLSSPPKAEEHRLGSGDNNLCLLSLPSMRSTPSGLPPFSYYFNLFASLVSASWLQQQQEF